MNLEVIMQSEMSQSQKDSYRMIPHMRDTKSNSQKRTVEQWLPKPRKKGEWGVIVSLESFSLEGEKDL